ncbi:hypothetical protein SLW70_10875 [Flavobacterium sp. NG2]|uniref:hypothetical protein n=1 Tax=Flavobacterium sp. NG2 TaxID=3097547 RepID=UPI002A821A43|nr:hypothetical protein [Flavobacterium sp. NG2]WPR70445.1 hypothetical protein SLW70_10875 [Flavobacterium sp. NG2]
MKKLLLFSLLYLIVTACGVKSTRNMLVSGNYDEAINNAISNIGTYKDKKSKQDYIYMLEEAFAKAKERDLNTINLLTKDGNPAHLEKIYNTYLLLNSRQESITPLLPLKLMKEGRNAKFPFSNYNNQIVESRNELSVYLYNNSKKLLASKDKLDFRKAFDDLNYLNKINPNYKDTNKLIDEAQFKGTDFVMVYTKNETNMIIPSRLLNDLMDFNTYGINDKWTVYHSAKTKGITYDYEMILSFRDIQISPEQIKEREFIKERQIIDGQKKLLDDKGKVVLDNKGKEVLVDNIIKATVKIYEIRQLKSSLITAKVDFFNIKNKQLLQSFPLSSEFIFENIYSNYKGDRRAADDNYMGYFNNKVVPFPDSQQMVYDTGEDLKQKLKNIVSKYKFNQ